MNTVESRHAMKVPLKGRFDNPVLENIYARRSVREFTGDRVPDELVGQILRAGTYAPSGVNKQPWRFAVIRGRERIAGYGRRAKGLWVERCKDATHPDAIRLNRMMTSLTWKFSTTRRCSFSSSPFQKV
jgi:Nitroreductase